MFGVEGRGGPYDLYTGVHHNVLRSATGRCNYGGVTLNRRLSSTTRAFVVGLLGNNAVGYFSPISFLSEGRLCLVHPLVFTCRGSMGHTTTDLSLPVIGDGYPTSKMARQRDAGRLLTSLRGRCPTLQRGVINTLRENKVDN